jgi:hypothetical protein
MRHRGADLRRPFPACRPDANAGEALPQVISLPATLAQELFGLKLERG